MLNANSSDGHVTEDETSRESQSVLMKIVEQQNETHSEIKQLRKQLSELQRCHDDRPEAHCTKDNHCLTEKHFHRISKDLVKKWKELSTELGLSQADIDEIDEDYKQSAEKTFHALQRWRQKETSLATMGALKRALVNIGRRDVSEILIRTFPNGVIDSTPSQGNETVDDPSDSVQSILHHISQKLQNIEDLQTDIKGNLRNISPREGNRESQEEEEEEDASKADEQRPIQESENPDSSNQLSSAQTLDEALDLLHPVLLKLTQIEAGQVIPEIKSLLKVEEFFEVRLERSIEYVTDRGLLETDDSDVLTGLKRRQKLRMEQLRQINKLVCQLVDPEEELNMESDVFLAESKRPENITERVSAELENLTTKLEQVTSFQGIKELKRDEVKAFIQLENCWVLSGMFQRMLTKLVTLSGDFGGKCDNSSLTGKVHDFITSLRSEHSLLHEKMQRLKEQRADLDKEELGRLRALQATHAGQCKQIDYMHRMFANILKQNWHQGKRAQSQPCRSRSDSNLNINRRRRATDPTSGENSSTNNTLQSSKDVKWRNPSWWKK